MVDLENYTDSNLFISWVPEAARAYPLLRVYNHFMAKAGLIRVERPRGAMFHLDFAGPGHDVHQES